jgi:hypothetical protein
MTDYYSVIARAVSLLPSKTDEARQAVYERARTALRETLLKFDPPLSETVLANEQAALDAAIRIIYSVAQEKRRHDRADHVFRDRVLGCGLFRSIIHSSGA